MRGIIYKATNTFNGKVYIGQTIRDMKTRSAQHIQSARRGAFGPFYDAIRYYGEDAFVWEAIETIEIDGGPNTIARYNIKPLVNEAERKHIRAYKADDPNYGYNMVGGSGRTYERVEIRIGDHRFGNGVPVSVYGVESEGFVGEYRTLNDARSKLGIDNVYHKIIRLRDLHNKITILPRIKYIAFERGVEEHAGDFIEREVTVREDQRYRKNKLAGE